MGQKLGGAVPLWGGEGELRPHLTQCGRGRGLPVPAYQVSSSSIQQFGHSTPTSQTDRQSDRQDRTDRQRPDSMGQTALQAFAQKLGKDTKMTRGRLLGRSRVRSVPVFEVDDIENVIKKSTLEIIVLLAAGGQ